MIFMGTFTMPGNKTDEWMKCSVEMAAKPLPPCLKKWQVFSCSAGEGRGAFKGYNLIYAEKGKGDEALIEINKLMLPFCQISHSAPPTEEKNYFLKTVFIHDKSRLLKLA